MRIKQSKTKIECELCKKLSSIQLFFKADNSLSYGRARHYIGMKDNKPLYEYHPQSLSYLQQKLVLELELGNNSSIIALEKGELSTISDNKNKYGAAERMRQFECEKLLTVGTG
jgi:hypothetical protein